MHIFDKDDHHNERKRQVDWYSLTLICIEDAPWTGFDESVRRTITCTLKKTNARQVIFIFIVITASSLFAVLPSCTRAQLELWKFISSFFSVLFLPFRCLWEQFLCAWPLSDTFSFDFEARMNVLPSISFLLKLITLFNICFVIKLSACPSWFLTLDHEFSSPPPSTPHHSWTCYMRSEHFSRSLVTRTT